MSAVANTAETVPVLDAGLGVVTAIELSVVTAAVLAILFYRWRQPALLAYIVSGLVLGTATRPLLGGSAKLMGQLSQLGLVLLLFIIGLELDLKGITRFGRRVAAAVLLQAPIAMLAIWGIQAGLSAIGLHVPGLGNSPASWSFFAVAAALSSTAVVVKLLADRFDLTSQAGRVTVLTLIAQDIWAVLALSLIATQGHGHGGGVSGIALMLGGAGLAVVVMSLVARHVVARVMAMMARAPDLIALSALAWCFAGTAALSAVGLSAEMGALVAGLTLGSLPVASEILGKLVNLRDFFMALFFVALGMSLPPPGLGVIGAALALVAIVALLRLVLFAPSLLAAGMGPVVSITSAINLAQISEFALLFVPIGIAQGAISIRQGSAISYGMMLSVVLSTYGITYNYRLAAALACLVRRRAGNSTTVEAARCGSGLTAEEQGKEHAPAILLLGFHHNAEALAQHLGRHAPHLLPRTLVIDYGLKRHSRVAGYGLGVVYGDISNPETLRHHGAGRASLVVSTISDTFLRGTSNLRLLQQVRSLNPRARFVATADNKEQASMLLRAGADGCICPAVEAAPPYARIIESLLEEKDTARARSG